MTEEMLFEEARKRPAGDRAAFLARACPDAALRGRVEALLAADAAPQPPLDRPGDRTQTFGDPAATGSFRPAAGEEEAEGVLIAGRYKLRQQIGEGGMGTVWMADQTEPVKRKVAVKLIRVERGQSKTILARFEAERQAIAVMDHPHIARLFDAGTTATGAPFFVMELVKGVPLNEFCDAHRLAVPDRLKLFTQVCAAVQHAHQKGVIHRDLKPGNVLVESHDGKPVPKVIDFGLAKATTGLQLTDRSMFTAFGAVMGTPAYMAPEQATFNAVDVDTRADVYALGVILYELLTGTTPITRESLKQAALDEVLKLIREQDAPPPSSRLSSAAGQPSVAANRQTEPAKLGRLVKGELDWIVMKALSKERDRRYESATGFARDVERFLNHEPVQAGPPTARYRLKKFVRRHRGRVVAAGLVLLALVAGIAGTTLGLVRAARAEKQALEDRDQAWRDSARATEAEGVARREGERAATNERAAQAAARAALRQAADSTLDKALALCERGDVNAGLLWLVDAVATADRGGAADLADAGRLNLAHWATSAYQPVVVRPSPGGTLVAVAAHPDGRRAATGSNSGQAVVWDLATGQPVGPAMMHPGPVNGCVFSPDGETLYTACADGCARAWNVRTRAASILAGPLRSGSAHVVTSRANGARSVSLDATGRTLAVAAAEIHLVDTVTGRPIGDPIRGPGQCVEAALDPAGEHVWGTFANWDTACWRLKDRVRVVDPVRHFLPLSIAAHPTKLEAVVGFHQSSAGVVFNEAGLNKNLMKATNTVHAVAYRPDGQVVAIGGADQFVRLFSADDQRPLGAPLRVEGGVRAVAFLPNGQGLIAVGLGGLRVWRAPSHGPDLTVPHITWVRDANFNADGSRIVTCCSREHTLPGEAYCFDAKSGKPIPLRQPPSGIGEGWQVAAQFLPDGRLFTAANDGVWYHWHPTDGTVARSGKIPGGIWRSAISPDGRRLLTGTWGVNAQLWDPDRQKLVTRFSHGPGGAHGVAFSPDSRLAATGGFDATARVWDAGTGQPVGPSQPHPSGVTAVAFGPRGDALITGCDDGFARVFALPDWKPLAPPLGHDSAVTGVSLSPDGRLAFTASNDSTARIWHVGTGRPVGPPLRHDDKVNVARVSPNGRQLLTASDDGKAKLWPVLPAWTGTAEELRQRAERLTGYRIAADRSVAVLSAEEFAARQPRPEDREPDRPFEDRDAPYRQLEAAVQRLEAIQKNRTQPAAERTAGGRRPAVFSRNAGLDAKGVIQGSNLAPMEVIFGEPMWQDYSVELEVSFANPVPQTTGRFIHVGVRTIEDRQCVALSVPIIPGRPAELLLTQKRDGKLVTRPVATAPFACGSNLWHAVRIDVRGKAVRCAINGETLFEAEVEAPPRGYVRLASEQSTPSVRNVRVTTPDGTPVWSGPPTLAGSESDPGPRLQEEVVSLDQAVRRLGAGEVNPVAAADPAPVQNPARRAVYDFREVHGADRGRLRAWLDDLPHGFRPVSIMNRANTDQPRFDAVAVFDGTFTEWVAHLDLAPEVASACDLDGQLMGTGGWSIASVCTYSDRGAYRRAHVWVRGAGALETYTYWTQGKKKNQATELERIRTARRVPFGLHSFGNDVPDFVVEPDLGRRWEFHDDLTAAQLEALADEAVQAGRRVGAIHCGMGAENRLRFAAVVLDHRPGGKSAFRIGLTATEYEQEVQRRRAAKLWPCSVASYHADGEARYAVAWTDLGDPINTDPAAATPRAKELLEKWRTERLNQLIDAHPVQAFAEAGALATRGLNLLKSREFVTAEQPLRTCLAIRTRLQPQEWTTFNTYSMLGGALLGQGKYAEAEPLLVTGYEGLKAREQAIPPLGGPRIPEALDRLIDLYTATDKPEEAKKYRELRAKYPAAKETAPRPREKP